MHACGCVYFNVRETRERHWRMQEIEWSLKTANKNYVGILGERERTREKERKREHTKHIWEGQYDGCCSAHINTHTPDARARQVVDRYLLSHTGKYTHTNTHIYIYITFNHDIRIRKCPWEWFAGGCHLATMMRNRQHRAHIPPPTFRQDSYQNMRAIAVACAVMVHCHKVSTRRANTAHIHRQKSQ